MNNEENTNEESVLSASEKFQNFVTENNLKLTYQFIPFSISRNSKEKYKSLNWRVTITSDKNIVTTDYSKGIGHLPYPSISGYNNLNNYQRGTINEAINAAIESGVARKVIIKDKDASIGIGKIDFPNPTMKEILECLTIDSNVKDYLTFEDWANDMGYETDSRSAEKIFNASKETASQFIKTLGSSKKVDELAEIIRELDDEPVVKKKNKM